MRKFAFLVFLFVHFFSFAQSVSDTTINAPMVSVYFGGHKPYGDMAARFGDNLVVGGSFLFKHEKTWILGIEGCYFFGRNVKDNITANMKNNENFIVDNEGYPADLRVTERGWTSYIVIGKVFPKLGHNPNSG